MPKPPQQKVPRSLLVLQLDSEKLRADGLSMAPLADGVRQLCGEQSELVEATTTRDLLDKLAALAPRKFTTVTVIGHANAEGIKVSNDLFVGWDGLAGFLKPFEPRRLVLIACGAGQWSAARTLFEKLTKLQRIFACPVNASRELAQMMLVLLPYVVEARVPQDKHILTAQIAGMALLGSQIRHWRRAQDMNDPDGVLLDLAAILANPVVREVPDMLRALLG